MAARIYLSVIGAVYLGLAIWCSVSPAVTSEKVGFALRDDSGRSEFLTVYGGLEFGMALIFLLPWVQRDATQFALIACLLIHASLVAFRSVSLVLYSDFAPMTGKLAVGEWVILISSAAVWFFARPR